MCLKSCYLEVIEHFVLEATFGDVSPLNIEKRNKVLEVRVSLEQWQ